MLQTMGLLGVSGLTSASTDTEYNDRLNPNKRHHHFDSINQAVGSLDISDGDTFSTNFYFNGCGGADYLVKTYSETLNREYLLDNVINITIS